MAEQDGYEPTKGSDASPDADEPRSTDVPDDQFLEHSMAALAEERFDARAWDAALRAKRRAPRLRSASFDPGPGCLRGIRREHAGVLLGRGCKPVPVDTTDNPRPDGSFGFVGVAAEVKVQRDLPATQLVLRFDPDELGLVARESLRMFRWDDARERFRLVSRSRVARSGNYVHGPVRTSGLYVLIGINTHPAIAGTIRAFCGFSDLIRAVPEVDSILRERICQVILCASQSLETHWRDPRVVERLGAAAERGGLPIPGAGGGGRPELGGVGDLCDRCLGMPGGVPPECEIVDEPTRPTVTCEEPDWQTVGPRDLAGHVRRVVVDPADPDRLYAAAFNGGIWALDSVTAYPSVSWRPLTDELDTLKFRSLKASPSHPATLYAGARTGRLYRSDDHGESWYRTSDTDLGTIHEILIHHSNPDVVFVATSGGLRRSATGGSTWAPALYAGNVIDAAMDPEDASILYIGVVHEGVLKSYLAGAPGTWELVLPWSSVGNPMRDGVDAALPRTGLDGDYYFFGGSEYTRFDWGLGVLPGYPRSISAQWSGWPSDWGGGIDAALLHSDGVRYYAFRGDEYLRYTPGDGVDPGYPKDIADEWSGWPAGWDSVDAALREPDGDAYWFFRGDRCLRYTPGAGVDPGYPKDITDEWSGWPAGWSSVDAAVLKHDESALYVFRGDEYLRFDTSRNLAPGYPRAIDSGWEGTRSRAIRLSLGVRNADGTEQSDADRRVAAKFGNEVFTSSAGGTAGSWSSKGKRDKTGYDTWCHCLAIHPEDPDIIFAGQQQLYRTEDGGDDWDKVATYYRPHEDQHCIAFDPTSPDTVYLANDGGVFRSTDGGRTWWTDDGTADEIASARNLNLDLVTAEFYRVGVKGSRALGNLYHSGIIGSRALGGGLWGGVEGHSWEFKEVYADPRRARRYYIFSGRLLLQLFPAMEGERETLRFSEFEPWVGGVVGPLAIDERPDSDILLVAADKDDDGNGYRLMLTREADVLPTYDEATEAWSGLPSWEVAIDNGDSVPIADVRLAPSAPGAAYAMARDGATFHADDVGAGTPWDTPGTWTPSDGTDIRQMAVNSIQADRLYAISRGALARSENGGQGWSEVGAATLPGTRLTSLVADPLDAGRLYLGALDGVYVSDDEGDVWSPFDDGLPNAVVTQIFRRDDHLYAVTHGRGLWRARIC